MEQEEVIQKEKQTDCRFKESEQIGCLRSNLFKNVPKHEIALSFAKIDGEFCKNRRACENKIPTKFIKHSNILTAKLQYQCSTEQIIS